MTGTKEALVQAATRLFAERGYAGASVRDICEEAGASANAVTYHFGSKEELYRVVLNCFADTQLAVAQRTLSAPIGSKEEFATRLEIFFSQLLDIYLANRDVIRILTKEFEQLVPMGEEGPVFEMLKTSRSIAEYVRAAIEVGVVSADVDPDIVAGLLLDRVINQARFTEAHQRFFGVSTRDETYREHWLRSTLRIVFHGICEPASPAT